MPAGVLTSSPARAGAVGRALPQVTLCIADTRTPVLAWHSLQHSMAGLDFGRVCLFTDEAGAAAVPTDPRIECVCIPTLGSGADYSRFIVEALPRHVQTSHVLVTQWDGFVVDPAAWRDEFLAWDYIGAVWPDQPIDAMVGNGGFSLRSQRFLEAARALQLPDWHPEDLVLCRTHRERLVQAHGLRFAPPALARHFAHENEAPAGPTLGFHGAYHLPRWLDEAVLGTWLTALPDEFFRGRDARRLARALLRHGMPQAAKALLRRRQAAGRRDANTRLLSAAAGFTAALQRIWPGRRAN